MSTNLLGPSSWRAYAGATLAAAAAVAARWLLGPAGETALPYVTVYPVLAITLWLGRFGPAAWAAGLALLLVEAVAPLTGVEPEAWRAGLELRLVTYAVALIVLAAFGVALRTVRVHLQRESARAAEEEASRRKASREAAQSEARARLALDVARLGTFSIARNGGALEVDERCRVVCGLPGGALTVNDLLLRMHPEDRARGEAALAAAWEPGAEPFAQELRFVHPDGTLRWVVSRGQVLRGTDGDRAASDSFVGTILDMTAARTAEQALQDADRRKDEFLATLAHELRNPLAPLVTSVALLRRAGQTASVRDQALAVMDRQLQHTVRLVNDLLDLSRVHQGHIELVMGLLRLGEVLEVAIETASPQIQAEQHTLELEMPAADVWVRGDSVRLSQAFTNLLNNAAKYTPRGGRIRLSTRCTGETVQVTVEDNGIGIAPSMQGRVFEMFAQVDRSASGSRGGLGIGLALSSRLVALHGGSLVVRSEGVGKGSAFTATLPRAFP